MGSWSPIRDFEDEMMDMQPDYDMIYGCTKRGNSSWHGDTLHSNKNPFTNGLLFNNEDKLSHKEQISSKNKAKVRELVFNNNNICKKIGRQYDENDSDSEYTKELEITNMIRNCGLESDLNEHLDSKKTLPTIQNDKKFKINGNNSNFIVLLDESYFKLKPKKMEKGDDTLENAKKGTNTKNNTSCKLVVTDKSSPTSTDNVNCTDNFTSNNTFVKSEENSLVYSNKMKFYTPREIYHKRKSLPKSKTTDVPTKKSSKTTNLSQ